MAKSESYLDPYVRAARRHGERFEALLWASPATQAARFAALARAFDFSGRTMLDAGCGRADLLDYLIQHGQRPGHYVGLEAVEELAAAASRKRHADALIVVDDFVKNPVRMLVGADAIVFCGSLNTFAPQHFYDTLKVAHTAAIHAVVFNFLCSPNLASADWLTWHDPQEVLAFCRGFGGEVKLISDYLDGDATVAIYKEGPHST